MARVPCDERHTRQPLRGVASVQVSFLSREAIVFESAAASRNPSLAGQCISDRHGDLASGASISSWTSEQFDAAWVSVAGQVTEREAYDLERTLFAALGDAALVVIEPHGLKFIDLAGLHAIVNVSIRARYRGRRLVLLPAPTNVQRVLSLAGEAVEASRIDPALTPLQTFDLLHACPRTQGGVGSPRVPGPMRPV